MNDARRHWTEEYYDAGDFFFWSPNRLGHVSASQYKTAVGAPYPGLPAYPDVLKWLRSGEEPLNHILGILFSLAPAQLIEGVFEAAIGERPEGPFSLLGTQAWHDLELQGATQPDFCFRASDALLTIEGKVRGGKSRLEQVVKYGLLAAQARELFGAQRCALVFLTPYQLDGIFSQTFADWDEVRRAAIDHIPRMTTQAFTTMDDDRRNSLVGALQTLTLGSLTYAEFDELLDERQNGAPEVEERLIAGVRHELARRGLTV